MSSPSPALIQVCDDFGKSITGLTHDGAPVSGSKLMQAIAGCESDYGRLREYVRMEKGYAPGGSYFKALHVRAEWNRWGCLAASSFGTFQLMYITAQELGYRSHPIDLQQDRVSGYWAMQLIVQRFIGRLGAKTLTDVLDCYNSGYHKDVHIPTLYIQKGIAFYNEL